MRHPPALASWRDDVMPMDRERLYGYLPIVLQNVACSLEGWRINRERYDADFDECLSAA